MNRLARSAGGEHPAINGCPTRAGLSQGHRASAHGADHPLLNALAMIVMIMGGWRIYTRTIFPFSFPVELTLGGSYEGSVDIHNEDGLAGAARSGISPACGCSRSTASSTSPMDSCRDISGARSCRSAPRPSCATPLPR